MGVSPPATPLASLVVDTDVNAKRYAEKHELPTSVVSTVRLDTERGVAIAKGTAQAPPDARTVVAAVECSADDGITWHPAAG